MARWRSAGALAATRRTGGALRTVLAAILATAASAVAAATAAAAAAAPPPSPPLPWIGVRAVNRTLNPRAARRLVLADEFGREVTLRGANLEHEERNLPPSPPGSGPTQRPIDPAAYAEGRCPNNTNGYQEPPICGVDAGRGKFNISGDFASRNDLAQARAYGLNFVRLCLSWSEIEPSPGNYSQPYLERVAQIVAWAEEQDVYVLLDFHEDNWSRYIVPAPNETGIPPYLVPNVGQDGAPEWAVVADGWPALAIFGEGPLNLASMKSFQNFYENRVVPGLPQGASPGPGLQDHYIGALAFIAARFKYSSAVLGIELMNEPEPGTTLPPLVFAAEFLYPFYKRAVQALTGERDGLPDCVPGASYFNSSACAYPDLGVRDTRHPIFFEPSAVRNLVDFSPQVSAPLTNFSQLVYTPHVYTGVFTLNLASLNISWPPSFDFAFDSAWQEANAMGAAVLVTEFGGAPSGDAETLAPTLAAQDAHMTGGSVWSFKSNCQGDGCDANAWVLYSAAAGPPTGAIPQNGPPVEPRLKLVSRTHARGVVGEALSYAFDNETLSFVLTANASATAGGGAGAASAAATRIVRVSAAEYTPAMSRRRRGAGGAPMTEVFVPASLQAQNVSVAGAASLSELVLWPDGSRTAYVAPAAAGGVYSVAAAATAGEAARLLRGALARHGPGDAEEARAAAGAAAAAAAEAAGAEAAGRLRALEALEARFAAARDAARLAGVELGG